MGDADSISNVLSRYASAVLDRELPTEVVDKTALHVLDTLGAIVSGRDLGPGRAGERYARANEGSSQGTVVGTRLTVATGHAALANAMAAHADETDDSHNASRTHPGCSILPSALAVAERLGRSGTELLRAVALGYDVAGRFPPALWPDFDDHGEGRVHSTHAFGGLFGSAMAVGALHRFDPLRMSYLISYATQRASGIRSYFREKDHIEKAFVFAGMPAFNAVQSAEFVACGWTGVEDPFSGEPTLFSMSPSAEPETLVDGLGTLYEVMEAKFKKYAVGSPGQSPVDVLASTLRANGIAGNEVARAQVRLSPRRHATVTGRAMANLNIDYLLSVVLEDGDLGFHAAHDEKRFQVWRERGGDPRIEVVADEALGTGYGATALVETTDGRRFTGTVEHIPGSRANPLSRQDVEHKALGLLTPRLGGDGATRLIEVVGGLDAVDDVRELRPLLQSDEGA